MEEGIINRVQSSSLLTLDLEEYYVSGERVFFDIKPFLYQEQILKEKEFRSSLKQLDLSFYSGKHVAIGCTVEAIIPTWAYMLLGITLRSVTKTIVFGSLQDLELNLFQTSISRIDWINFKDAKVVIKGCSKIIVPTEIYVEVAARLNDVASSIMYGEACSTVPLYKRHK